MGPPSRSEISDVAMVTAAVAILVLGQLSIIGKIRGNPRASRIFYRRQNGDPESPLTPTVLYSKIALYIVFASGDSNIRFYRLLLIDNYIILL